MKRLGDYIPIKERSGFIRISFKDVSLYEFKLFGLSLLVMASGRKKRLLLDAAFSACIFVQKTTIVLLYPDMNVNVREFRGIMRLDDVIKGEKDDSTRNHQGTDHKDD